MFYFVTNLLSVHPLILPVNCNPEQLEPIALDVIWDTLTILAGYIIAALLLFLTRQRQDFPFRGGFWLFAAFLICWNTTHFLEMWRLWHQTSWFSSSFKAITAFIALGTGTKLITLIPQALAFPSLTQLELTNQALQSEINQYQQAEAATKELVTELWQQTRIFDAFLSDTPDRIAIYSREGKYRYISPSIARALGLQPRDIIGKTWRELNWPTPLVERLEAKREITLTTGRTVKGVTCLPTADGISDYEYTFSPVIAPDGTIEATIAVFKDITFFKRTEQDYENFFTLSLDLLCIAGFDGYFKRLNSAWENILGYSSEELFSKPYIEFVHPEDQEATLANMQKLEGGEELIGFENRFICKDGSYRWLLWHSAPYTSGKTIYAVASDITDRKQAEAERSRLVAILEASTDFIGITDLEGNVLWNNEQGKKIMGLAPDENLFQLRIVDYQPQWAFNLIQTEGLPAAVRDGVWVGETALLNRSGVEVPVSQMIIAHKSATGSVEYFSTIMRDISDRKQIEAALKSAASQLEIRVQERTAELEKAIEQLQNEIAERQKAQSELDRIFNLSVDMLCILGSDDYFKRVNPAVSSILGYSPEEFMARPWFEFVHPEDRKATQTVAWHQMDSDSTSVYFENRYRSKDGSYKWLSWSSVPLLEEGLIYAIARDVTALKQVEEALHRRSAAIEAATDGIAVLDSNGAYIYMNQAHTHVYGYSNSAELLGKTWQTLYSADELERFDRQIMPEFRAKGWWRGEAIGLKRDRTTYPQELSLTALEDGGLICVVRDITQRKQAEENQNRILAILEATPDLVGISDASGQALYINQAGREMLGLAINESLVKTHITDFLSPLNLELMVNECLPTAIREGVWSGENLFLDRQGREIPTSQVIIAHKSANNEVEFFSTIARDITAAKRAEAALRDSEARYQSLTEASPVGIFYTNAVGECLYVNDRWCEISGLKPPAAFGQGWSQAIHPEDRARVQAEWNQAAFEHLPFTAEYRFQRPDGQVKWVFAQAVSLVEESGQVKSYVGTITDISDRVQAEEKIKQLNETLERRVAKRTAELELSNQQLQTEIAERQRIEETLLEVTQLQWAILDGANYSIISTDPSGVIRTFNTTAETWLGYSAEEVVGKVTLVMIHDPQEVAQRATVLSEELGLELDPGFEVLAIKARQGGVDENEWTYLRKDGSRFPVELSVTCLWDIEGNITGFLGIASDITERKEAAKALLESEQRFRTMADSAPVLLWIAGTDAKYYFFNQTWLNFTGRTVEEEIGDGWLEGVHPEDSQQCLETYQMAFENRAGFRMEYRLRHTDGDYRWLLDTGTPRFLPDGSFAGYIGSCIDISERKEVEAALQHLTDDLKRSNQELEQFAYVASHDLQEPLRAVTSYTQLLAQRYQGNLDAKADKYINYIVDGATRMQQLINDLLAYSRVGTKGKEFQPTNCDAAIKQALTNLQMAIAEKNATITYESLPTLLADEGQLVQLFQNLIGNAIKFCREDIPLVQISIQQRETEWLFGIHDNGIGIEPDYAERIFIIFQRLHSRREYSGTGIGLAICKRIVERHGGRIWVDSQLGQGATFYFTIPIHRQ